jgi:hypothetical protein
MKKVLGSMSKFIFGGFGIAVLALLMTLTYGALQKLFPNSFSNQMWGLVMFDIAAMCWAICFVFLCKSTVQYAVAGLGFVVAFVGTLGMVAAEVMLSGQTLTQTNTSEIGQWMVYGFIVVTAIHAGLVYAHHAGAPDIAEQINVGVARGEIVTEAITQATKVLDEEKQSLALTIRNDIISQAKRDLGLIEADPRMPFLPKSWQCQACGENNLAHRTECIKCGEERGHTLTQEKKESFLANPKGWWQERFGKKEQAVPQVREQEVQGGRNGQVAWIDLPGGQRRRIFCMICKSEGKPWHTEEPCEHVLNGTPMPADLSVMNQVLNEAFEEDGEYTRAPQSEPSGGTRPLYSEEPYHSVPMNSRKQNPE